VKNFTALSTTTPLACESNWSAKSGAVMPKGGGAPFFGEQRQIQVVSGNYAWKRAGTAGQRARGRSSADAAAQSGCRTGTHGRQSGRRRSAS
jgi:hypothetical protein